MDKGTGVECVNAVLGQIVDDWYARVREHYVTDADSEDLGLEPEVKLFHERKSHRLKFSRQNELDVTYGLAVEAKHNQLRVIASVNNKSEGFDFDMFVERLKAHYWKSRHEKPWTEPSIDHFAYGDLLDFEPRMGKSVSLDIRKDKADIIRLFFELNSRHLDLLLGNRDLLRDLIESYCLNPLKRIYAESYREH